MGKIFCGYPSRGDTINAVPSDSTTPFIHTDMSQFTVWTVLGKRDIETSIFVILL